MLLSLSQPTMNRFLSFVLSYAVATHALVIDGFTVKSELTTYTNTLNSIYTLGPDSTYATAPAPTPAAPDAPAGVKTQGSTTQTPTPITTPLAPAVSCPIVEVTSWVTTQKTATTTILRTQNTTQVLVTRIHTALANSVSHEVSSSSCHSTSVGGNPLSFTKCQATSTVTLIKEKTVYAVKKLDQIVVFEDAFTKLGAIETVVDGKTYLYLQATATAPPKWPYYFNSFPINYTTTTIGTSLSEKSFVPELMPASAFSALASFSNAPLVIVATAASGASCIPVATQSNAAAATASGHSLIGTAIPESSESRATDTTLGTAASTAIATTIGSTAPSSTATSEYECGKVNTNGDTLVCQKSETAQAKPMPVRTQVIIYTIVILSLVL